MRLANLNDLPELVNMGMSFAEHSDYKDIADEETISQTIQIFLNSPQYERMILIEEGKAMLGAAISPSLYSKDRVATEVFWWVNPEFRKEGIGNELLSAFEYWAKQIAKADMIAVSTLNDSVEELYLKKGYKAVEKTYMKVID